MNEKNILINFTVSFLKIVITIFKNRFNAVNAAIVDEIKKLCNIYSISDYKNEFVSSDMLTRSNTRFIVSIRGVCCTNGRNIRAIDISKNRLQIIFNKKEIDLSDELLDIQLYLKDNNII